MVENRAGQGGMIAAKSVIESPPDGYTIMFVAPNNAIGQTLYKNLPFNHVRDTTPIAGTMQLANIMVVPPDLPVKTVAEFIAYAKANPGKVTFASSGNGTSVHMSGELFKMMTNLDILHVPYRGSAGIYPDLMTGKVHALFDNLPGSIEFVQDRQAQGARRDDGEAQRGAAGSADRRRDGAGLRGERVLRRRRARRAFRPQVVEMLNKAFNAALADPKIKERIAQLGGEPTPMTPARVRQAAGRRDREVGQGGAGPPTSRWSERIGHAMGRDSLPHARIVIAARSRRGRRNGSVARVLLHVLGEEVRWRASTPGRELSLWKLPRSSQWKP